MKELPILFNAPMVRALLDGSKTQTRRIMKPQPEPVPHRPGDYQWPCNALQSMVSVADTRAPGAHGMAGDACPHGAHRDQIWVRETFFAYGRWVTRYSKKKGRDERHFIDMTAECDRTYQYDADSPDVPAAAERGGAQPGWYKRPAIFMTRAASRTLLAIVSVRVERLNDCSEVDALAEGAKAEPCDHVRMSCDEIGCCGPTARGMYAALWDQINGAGAWAGNPWVWVIEFKQVPQHHQK
ncbi:hypothetical protein [Janthinobacterium sp. SUN033]|uniref:hypothetical protein n=1 Tax=Janthinobacterium sp. SUN033 TaxID=3002439 RepID=UPI0025B1A97C|nr:hypothetical protein [Janthinobacterium sp. SUN033]MDN2675670.1 hypothetical protein [Janthinobacterium sp. SUN033]